MFSSITVKISLKATNLIQNEIALMLYFDAVISGFCQNEKLKKV